MTIELFITVSNSNFIENFLSSFWYINNIKLLHLAIIYPNKIFSNKIVFKEY